MPCLQPHFFISAWASDDDDDDEVSGSAKQSWEHSFEWQGCWIDKSGIGWLASEQA